jgi:YedE family putative selenium metabolism protein
MIGALVFLGCPWRAILRLAGGDANAIIGLAGLVSGIFVGTRFFVMGYDPGSSKATNRTVGLVLPLLAVGAVILLLMFQPVSGQTKNGLLFCSVEGPGAAHANVFISLGAGLLVGLLLQRSRFCTIGGFRDLILFRQFHLVSGVIAMTAAALIVNLALGQFKPGMECQPGAHTMWLWNFLGMVLAGLAFTLGGGCPGRQCVLAGEGDSDSAMFVLGMLAGAAFAHNFALAASPKGVGLNGQVAVVLGLLVCCVIGFTVRRKVAG